MTCVCQFCNARKWAGDPVGLYCSSGKVRLPLLHESPTPLRGLIAGSNPDSDHFLKTIRQYNSFQMTSFGAQVVREEGWMPTFKEQGQVYHRTGSLLPEETSMSKFLQLYFIADYNLQAETWIGILPLSGRFPCRDVILLLQATRLTATAPFPSFSIVNDADKRPHDEHKRRYNAPAWKEVAAMGSKTALAILSSDQEAALFAGFQRPVDHMTHCSTLYFSLTVILRVANLQRLPKPYRAMPSTHTVS
ncbi:unnamed protein product [Acanthosepion pharaonis]|uniref:Uncharacterized protein n=1 Tax=Acanthosepion pharaonis TaxID=158019 RepID=A0A812E0E4_ACAPH|nr:unnamed protein product [Sepia pharaonis]